MAGNSLELVSDLRLLVACCSDGVAIVPLLARSSLLTPSFLSLLRLAEGRGRELQSLSLLSNNCVNTVENSYAAISSAST